ncbi:hypothetical protein [Actinoplanes sp. NPDC051859]|uniref:hypothetical protein n=1 Tax=Actinoplanes sp. NPDC051859 TaxID=3363909 RepID=UPI0037A75768
MTDPDPKPLDLAAAVAAHQADQQGKRLNPLAQALNDALQPGVDRLRQQRNQPAQPR